MAWSSLCTAHLTYNAIMHPIFFDYIRILLINSGNVQDSDTLYQFKSRLNAHLFSQALT